MLPDFIFQQSTKLRDSHTALGYGFVNGCQTRTNQISKSFKYHLIAFIVSKSYRRHSICQLFLLQK